MRTAISRAIDLMAALRRRLLGSPVFTSTILPAIPRPLRWALRRLYFLPFDLADRLLGHSDDLSPPKAAIVTGSVEGFRASGERLVEMLQEHAGLRPDCRVVDVGSGFGRLAVPLTRFLSPAGSYDGLDIGAAGIEWCNEKIAPRHPNFRFTLADVHNSEYNPSGRYPASEYRFPYEDESVDLVVLVSVFTHMLAPEMEHYLSEIQRILVKDGRCFATHFLVNEESSALMESGRSSLRLRHRAGPAWLVSPGAPELSVGYDEGYARELYSRLFSDTALRYGGWCGRPPLWAPESGLGDQDVIVATK